MSDLERVTVHIPSERSIARQVKPGGDRVVDAEAKVLPAFPRGWEAASGIYLAVRRDVAEAIEDGDIVVSRAGSGAFTTPVRVREHIQPRSSKLSKAIGDEEVALLCEEARDNVSAAAEIGQMAIERRKREDAERRETNARRDGERAREQTDRLLGEQFTAAVRRMEELLGLALHLLERREE